MDIFQLYTVLIETTGFADGHLCTQRVMKDNTINAIPIAFIDVFSGTGYTPSINIPNVR
jgi:hypothetical protein